MRSLCTDLRGPLKWGDQIAVPEKSDCAVTHPQDLAFDLPFGPDADPLTLTQKPVDLHLPDQRLSPIIVASPHSGRLYPPDFVSQSRLDPVTLRRSEDAYVDCLFADAPGLGLPLLRALFPRAMVDPNRDALELDPRMFNDTLPRDAMTKSPRVAAGLGTIPRVVTNGEPIFDHKIRYADVGWRVPAFRTPYHQALAQLIRETQQMFGAVLVIDAHSMPSLIGTSSDPAGYGASPLDIVLGDGHGTTCHPEIVAVAEHTFAECNLNVVRNVPYAGGYTTRHYGHPERGVHVLQIEINRALYLDEKTVTPTQHFDGLRSVVERVLRSLIDAVDPIVLRADVAAE